MVPNGTNITDINLTFAYMDLTTYLEEMVPKVNLNRVESFRLEAMSLREKVERLGESKELQIR